MTFLMIGDKTMEKLLEILSSLHSDVDFSATEDLVDDGILDMIQNTLVQMRKFRQPDHGFGYLQCGSSRTSNAVVVSLGLPEGDVNALALMRLIYNEAYALTGRKYSDPWKQYKDYFWNEIKKKRDPYIN